MGYAVAAMDEVLYNLGLAYEAAGDLRNARGTYDDLIKRFPSSPFIGRAFYAFRGDVPRRGAHRSVEARSRGRSLHEGGVAREALRSDPSARDGREGRGSGRSAAARRGGSERIRAARAARADEDRHRRNVRRGGRERSPRGEVRARHDHGHRTEQGLRLRSEGRLAHVRVAGDRVCARSPAGHRGRSEERAAVRAAVRGPVRVLRNVRDRRRAPGHRARKRRKRRVRDARRVRGLSAIPIVRREVVAPGKLRRLVRHHHASRRREGLRDRLRAHRPEVHRASLPAEVARRSTRRKHLHPGSEEEASINEDRAPRRP